MNANISVGQFGFRPPVTKPHPDFLKLVGEDRLRNLVTMHYELLRTSSIAYLFPINDDEEFEQAKKNAADFMIQICGGHPYFNENRGAPRMVGRHAPFRITEEARVTWLALYKKVLKELEGDVPEPIIKSFWDYLDVFSQWMVNTPTMK